MRCPKCKNDTSYRYKVKRANKKTKRTDFSSKCSKCKYEGTEPYEQIGTEPQIEPQIEPQEEEE